MRKIAPNCFAGPQLRAAAALVAGLLTWPVHTAYAADVAAPLSSPPDRTVARALERELAALERDADLSGAVLLARGGRVQFARAFGYAERTYGIRNSLDTRFNLASINKMLTALAILRLAEAGRLDLDAPLAAALPNYPNADVAARVTVRQLLNHTSGLGNYWEAFASQPAGRFLRAADYLPLFAAAPLEHPPGTAFGYSNSGYVVLGLVVEAVTGEDYDTHVDRTILRPLEMRDTGCYRLDVVVPRLATGYMRSEERPGEWRNNLFDHVVRGGPAGGCWSTVGDLQKFGAALHAGVLLGPTFQALYTSGTLESPIGRQALGLNEQYVNGRRIVGHSGGHAGIAGELLVFMDTGHVAVILTNGDVDAFWHTRNRIVSLLAGRDARSAKYWNTVLLLEAAATGGIEAARRVAAADGPHHEGLIDLTASRWAHRGRPQLAVELLELNATLFPQSESARERLAEFGAVLRARY